MELGMYSGYREEQAEHYHRLGIKWFGVGYSTDPGSEDPGVAIETIEQATRNGGQCFIKWISNPATMADESAWQSMPKRFKRMARELPVSKFEIFPEPSCPFNTAREFNIQDYMELLRIAHESIKEERPDAEVWNGGIGFFQTLWGLADFYEEGLPHTDALNLHPFFFGDNYQEVTMSISNLLLEAQYAMMTLGQEKPIVVTEWGAPTKYLDAKRYLSNVTADGVPALSEADQALAYAHVLSHFEDIGCPIFCFNFLADKDTKHWSGHTGMIRLNGSLKPSYEVVYNWGQKHKQRQEAGGNGASTGEG